MQLETVGNYVTEARVLIQDTLSPYRTPDPEIKNALGMAIFELRRIRPDMFVFTSMPDISSATADGTAVAIEAQFRVGVLHAVVGFISLKDEEEGSEGRASAFMRSFVGKMLGVAA